MVKVKTQGPWVAHHVLLQLIHRSEADATDKTLLKVLHHVPMVPSFVHPEAAALGKCLPTHIILIWFLAGMYTLVGPQFANLGERITKCGASVGLLVQEHK
jgi:hypothetical protein